MILVRTLIFFGVVCLSFAQTGPMLRSHVEFLASDSLLGRRCPSRSCDIAADYILAQFRGAGLETQVQTTEATYEVRRGEAVAHPWPAGSEPHWIAVDAPAKPNAEGGLASRAGAIPKSPDLEAVLNATGNVTVTAVPSGLRNVIGVIRGRDPVLRDTYVLVTAHYDHEGEKQDQAAGGDSVFNGANDNASGVSALIEMARAIASAPLKPRRSVAFIAYFGEESGMVGSRYYAQHPVFPIEKTYVQVNLEQLGRTDDTEGPRVKAATVTGYDRSDLGAILATAAKPAGIRIYKHEKFSDAFFERSDNEALAKKGIAAHTVSVAYGFPDYHGLADTADKLDYANMTAVTRALRAGIVTLANRRLALPLRPLGTPAPSATPRAKSPAASAPKSGSSPATPRPKQ